MERLNTLNLKTQEDIDAAKLVMSCPGDTIAELIEYYSISQKDLADRLGRPVKTISEIINGKAAITPDTAIALERVLEVDAGFWLRLDQSYQLRLIEVAQAEERLENLAWLKNFPLAEMAKLGWLSTHKKSIDLYDELLNFFGVANAEGFNRTYLEVTNVRFRRSLKKATNQYNLAVWLRKGERDAKGEHKPYSEALFKQCLTDLKELVINQPTDFRDQVTAWCAEAGVMVIHTETLKNTPVDGVTRWMHHNPVIQLSEHLKSADRYWFTFFHEAGHVLMHPKTNVYLEGVAGMEDMQQHEEEANAFAQQRLLAGPVFDAEKHQLLTLPAICSFATAHNTHPGIVLGRLQKEGILPWNTSFNAVKQLIGY